VTGRGAPRPALTRDSVAVRLPGPPMSLDDLTPAWAWQGATGAGVRVAVIDSGIDADHPALEGCVDAGNGIDISISPDGEVVQTAGDHHDVFGHGTACAGIIHSFAPEARITSIRVLGEGLSGKAESFLAGLQWAVDNDFDVVNLSLGTRKRDWALAFYELCDRAYFNGTFLTTAANNMDMVSYPSLFASVASVACNMSADPWRFHYNPQPPTEFLARGIDIEVAWRDGGTMTSTGNSYAAPHIAGLAALIGSKHPDLNPAQLKTVLTACAANVREADGRAGRLSRSISRSTTRATRATRSTLTNRSAK
jgi:subtilisin